MAGRSCFGSSVSCVMTMKFFYKRLSFIPAEIGHFPLWGSLLRLHSTLTRLWRSNETQGKDCFFWAQPKGKGAEPADN